VTLARRCSKEIDGPKINGAGVVAWRRGCRNMTKHPTGRCRFHPLRHDDDRRAWYPGERTVDHEDVR
jgi:hypothetical protein